MTDEIWEFVFCDGPWPSSASFSREKAEALRHEFNYFYPFDIRSSGKDLVPNHLTFCVYNHAALFPEKRWPRSIRTNGHLMLNGKKMSKSKGISLTLRQGIDKFGADATRLALADAGDGVEDANFDEKTANANILRVHTLLGWCEVSEILKYVGVICMLTMRRTFFKVCPICVKDRATRTTTVFSRRKLTTSLTSHSPTMRRKY